MPVTAITLVCNPADPAIDDGLADMALGRIEAFGRTERATLADGVAEDFLVAAPITRECVSDALVPIVAKRPIDIIVQPASIRRKRLLIADMDSTIIGQECIDELADFAGLKAAISAITDRAMRGELEFEAALTERVALLKGTPESVLERTFSERISLNPGAATLVATMNRLGASTILVSGGFDYFVERVARLAGFGHWRANRIAVENGTLTGAVRPPILGREAKKAALHQFAEETGAPLPLTLAVGDGANDLGMIESAGLGVAYRAKPKVVAAAAASIRHADLTALLYAQGLSRVEFAPV